MERLTFFIIVCIAGVIGAFVTLAFAHWACMVAVIIIIPAIALSLDTWRRELRETSELLEKKAKAKQMAITSFRNHFDMDNKRAELVYNAGYRKIDDFKGKSVQELMEIDDINPTLAKRIYYRMNENEN
jgi:hypothetical protein